jgi:hypothetical protein
MNINSQTNPPSGNRKILLGIAGVIVICLCILVCSITGLFFLRNADSKNSAQVSSDEPKPTPSFLPTPNPETQTWLVMLYFDADDPLLEEDILFDLNEAEMVGSTERVKIVAQLDRNKKGYKGDGNWTGARRYVLSKDQDLEKSKVVKDLGEIDMSDPQTLVEFATWAIETYPADKTVLIMSDHGMGWPGGWTDMDNNGENHVFITTARLDNALRTIIDDTGLHRFELIGMDACLMSMLEVYNTLAPYAKYAVASEDVEPGVGWAYAGFLRALAYKPEMSGAELSKSIVTTYIDKDLRILNDKAREKLLSRYGLDSTISAKEIIAEFNTESTLSAVNLEAMLEVNSRLDAFVNALKDTRQKKIAEARAYTRTFTNTFDDNLPSPYLDLGHFASMVIKKSGDEKASKAASELRQAIKKAVVAEKHGSKHNGATGISIFFPVSDIYWNENVGIDIYTNLSARFVKNTLWDDFLAFHYAGQDFDQGIPDIQKRVPAPGLGSDIQIAPLVLSSNSIAPGDSVNVQTEIRGSQIAYIYLLTLYEKDANNFLVYSMDYIQGNDTKEEDGVFYPVWNHTNGKITINMTWTPMADGVCNGETCAFAWLEPETYGEKKGDIIYSTAGKYRFIEDELIRDARMFFRNDTTQMTRIIGYTGNPSSGIAVSPITPAAGDAWQVLETWIERTNDGKFEFSYHESNEIPFAGKPFYFRVNTPNEGKYRIAIMVKDMDGNDYFQFASLNLIE